MAEYLANIFCTSRDHVNCKFDLLVGSRRNGVSCKQHHVIPVESFTVVLRNLHQGPGQEDDTKHFNEFMEDMFWMFSKAGEIEDVYVSQNIAVHLRGNVYVQFRKAEDAAAAVQLVTGRRYDGRKVAAELSNTIQITKALCRDNLSGRCEAPASCRFLHLKLLNGEVRSRLMRDYVHRR